MDTGPDTGLALIRPWPRHHPREEALTTGKNDIPAQAVTSSRYRTVGLRLYKIMEDVKRSPLTRG
jgi:hypothetical protein